MALQNHCLTLLFLTFSLTSFSQTDSISCNGYKSLKTDSSVTIVDTVIVNKSPYIIYKYIYISKPKRERKKKNKLVLEHYLGYFAGPVFYKNNYCNCPEYGDYLNQVRKNTKPLTSYEIGLNYNVIIKSIVTDLTIKFNSLHEQYAFYGNSYTILPTGPVYDTYTYNNVYNFLSLEAGIGYVYKIKRISISVLGRGSVDHLTHANAISLDPGMNSVTNVNNLETLRKDVYYLGASWKFSYNIFQHVSLMIEPYYRLSLNSYTNPEKTFPVNRNIFSLRIGVIHQL